MVTTEKSVWKLVGELIVVTVNFVFNCVVGWHIGHVYGVWLGWFAWAVLQALDNIVYRTTEISNR